METKFYALGVLDCAEKIETLNIVIFKCSFLQSGHSSEQAPFTRVISSGILECSLP